MAKMLGKTHMVDAGGRGCPCCYPAPKNKSKMNRSAKRGKSGTAWKRDTD